MRKHAKAPGPSHTHFRTLERLRSSIDPLKDGHEYPALQEISKPHVQSFNAMFDSRNLLGLAVADIMERVVFDGKGVDAGIAAAAHNAAVGNKLTLRIDEVTIAKPAVSERDMRSVVRQVYPTEARERLTNYSGRITARLCWRVNNGPEQYETKVLGHAPIMVRSNRCNLEGMSAKELVQHGEEADEFGGYFIINGNEKIIRMLVMTKRNHVLAIQRKAYANRGPMYSEFGTMIRCVRPDESAQTNVLHYLNDGTCMFSFNWRKQQYLIPVVLIMKALIDTNDKEICEELLQGEFKNTFLTEHVGLLLQNAKSQHGSAQTRAMALALLGSKFRIVLGFPADWSDEEIGARMLDRVVLVHLSPSQNRDKFRLLCFMIRKLYALRAGECAVDNPDTTQVHEVLLGGHLYLNILKEKLEDWLFGIQSQVVADLRRNPGNVDFTNETYIRKAIGKVPCDIGQKLQYFLATGNLISKTGLDLQQVSGFTTVAEKLNFLRYISHFRSIHRGAFFAELKTTTVRKLLPESWGFLCPVHTPDGTPCGLLNHLTHACQVVTHPGDVSSMSSFLASLGVSHASGGAGNVTVQLDGRIVGYVSPKRARQIAESLRYWKVKGEKDIPLDLEIGYVPLSEGGQYPGLYLFSHPARLIRPVRYLATGDVDLVGPFEQAYMEIACLDRDAYTTHQELAPTQIFSIVGNMTPFCDYNPAARNMYQCQMGKQTMGTPGTALSHRTDNKSYRIQNVQTPLVRPRLQDTFGFDSYPNGNNAVIAVLSYTGYDMEDAMVINKSAHERGFGYGTILKSEIVDLGEFRRAGQPITLHFGLGPDVFAKLRSFVDDDGLPFIGQRLTEGDPLCAYVDDVTGRTKIKRYKGTEVAYVDEVRLLGSDAGDQELQCIHIKLRIPRAPVIGDKFSSRHGQKGVCSQKWPLVDMAFSETGITPDVIINPHAFPSRMTIGMFVEQLAAKAGALQGVPQDSTAFMFGENVDAVDFFGDQLRKCGYNYYGNEPMYSGVSGEEMRADIYLGIVYYQRLRHMVSDKYQVRTTGPVQQLTQQPLKGRKRGGGIRFGEMERDSLLAHGTAFLLNDRLMNSSDYCQAYACRKCGSIISPITVPHLITHGRGGLRKLVVECRACASSEHIVVIALPYVFRYLAAELAVMNIRLSLRIN
ncbi:beta and beta-prime subunits of DNA dependent RNA-polymerase [Ramicandelaber brevisporus]|nr:beta and beta-prime subunits of DNA dependent RNA-polymerase [Ramicandelaber brevisporus]